MHEILRAKFQHSAKYRDALLQSGQRPLSEQNRHPFWGGISGHNRLGLLHMKVRDAATNGDLSLANTKPGNETSIRISQPNQNAEARVNLRVVTKDKGQVYGRNITARQHVPAGMVKNSFSKEWNHSISGSLGGSRDSDRNTSIMPNKLQTQRRAVAIIGDSNTRALNSAWMSKRYDFRKYEAMTTSEAVHIVSDMETPDIALLHVRTNDIRHQSPHQIADKIQTTAQRLTVKGTKVIVSNILPREGMSYTHSISETNAILTSQLNNVAGVTLMNNDQFAYGSRASSNLFATKYNSGQQYVSIHRI